MVDTEPLTPALQPHEPRLQLHSLDGDRIQEQQQQAALALYHHQYQQVHQHSDHNGISFQSEDQLDDITHDFLIQGANSESVSIGHGSSPLALQAHISATTEIEEELNIYDYIHAKQEDDEDAEDHTRQDPDNPDLSRLLSPAATFESTLEGSLRRASHQSAAAETSSLVDSAYSPSSPSSSLLSYSSPSSPSSPSESAYAHIERINTSTDRLNMHGDSARDMDGGADVPHESEYVHGGIKQDSSEVNNAASLMHRDSYMDSTPVDLYGPEASSLMQSSQGDLNSPAPTQDLFRTLMDELQTQAAIQREKFFSATTGSDTGMDSVEFLFKGQPTQTHSQPSTPTKQLSHSMNEKFMSNSTVLVSAGNSEPSGESAPESSNMDLCAAQIQSGLQTKDNASDFDPASISSVTEGLPMEITEAEAELSSSPSASQAKSSKSPSSSRAGIVHVAFTRIAKRHLKTGSNSTAEPQIPSPSVEMTVQYSSGDRSASLSPVTEMSFQSVLEQRCASSPSTETPSAADGPKTKRRKLSRVQVDMHSPMRDVLPSPPASVQTTPPLQPMTMDSPMESANLDLLPQAFVTQFPSCNGFKGAIKVSTSTSSRLDAETAMAVNTVLVTEAGALSVKPEQAESSSHTASTKHSKKVTLSPNAVNKRPWTVEEEKLLLELVDSKTPIKDIAETLNRSVHSVRSRRQVLTDPGFVKGNGHAQPRRAKPDPSSKLPTYSQMAFLSLARLPELQGTLNDVASMVEKLFSRHLNRIPRTGHKNLQIWRAQISDALAHEKGHPRPRFESFGVKRGRQWVYRLTTFGKGVMEAMGSVDRICDDLLKNNEMAGGSNCGPDGESSVLGGAGAGLGQGNGYGYSYSAEKSTLVDAISSSLEMQSTLSSSDAQDSFKVKVEATEETSAESLAVSNAIANAMAAMAAGMAAMTAVEDERLAATASTLAPSGSPAVESPRMSGSVDEIKDVKDGSKKTKHGSDTNGIKRAASLSGTRVSKRSKS
ncbi:hypothetical protein BGX28_007493 [Mortierella sp. GBA30]|nr:hypothetical protein BGX28_007493 [Mortierella sp. GBA30]